MPGLTHSAKVVIAKRLRTHEELVGRVPIFETQGWENRKKHIYIRTQKRQAVAHYQAEQRKAKKREEATSGSASN